MSVYIAIDLKSFYASVECVERGYDPLTTNLVVADKTRTEKTICLAVSPSLKSYGISGRARLYEVVQKVKEVNRQRRLKIPSHRLIGDSIFNDEIINNPSLALNYYIATPRMAYYMKYSSKIYEIYLKYVSKDDIHVYSIDEVFIDATSYLKTYNMNAHELAMTIIHDILNNTGITATCGIGTNLYLAKVAMDIVAKRMKADKDGVRISELDEMSYRNLLWNHKPLTDFWRIGKGISARLENAGLYTQGDIARMSLTNEDKLYKMFGINAELLIDHAWGYEPTTISEIKSYIPVSKSISSGQVLKEPYSFDKAKLIIKEMIDQLSLDLVEKEVVTNQIVLTIGYDNSNIKNYFGEIVKDPYGRPMPKMAHGTINIDEYTNATFILLEKTVELFDMIVNPKLTVRRMYVVANHIMFEKDIKTSIKNEQMDLFTNYEEKDLKSRNRVKAIEKERKAQEAIIKIKRRHGKNSIIKLNSLEEGATAIDRNKSIGGHKA